MVTVPADEGLPVSEAVLEAVADVTASDTSELDPLFRAVDPEALDRLCVPRSVDGSGPLGITFEYGGCRITVERREDGTVSVTVRPVAE